MKTITLIMLAFFFGSNLFAQETNIAELLQRLEQNHMGSITDVFTNAEISTLRTHFDSQLDEEPVRYSGMMLIRATENTNGDMAIINPMNPKTVEIIAPSPLNDFEGAGAVSEDGSTLIVVDNNNIFYEVNNDGTFVTIGEIPALNGQSFTGLEYSSDGILYGIATDGAGSTRLYEIDLMGGQADPVGSDNGLVVGIALGRDANNNLYAYDIDTNLVHRIDRVTGLPTLLGNIGFDPNFGQGMGYDDASGSLYITAFNNDTFKPELRTVNTSTGASTLVGTIEPSQTLQFAWMSFFDVSLGVDETSTQNVSIAPNPVDEKLLISGDINIDTVLIHSTLGQLLLEVQPNTTSFELNVANFDAGAYFITVVSSAIRITNSFIKN